mmetsp:Transcript_2702/g.9082  ORF Transcript_2702/g.9082 Transcript_2702/m.9082 type:complete len:1072 (-) Transcript_2702:252-3467(-)
MAFEPGGDKAGKMVHVKVSTTEEGHEGWVLELDVARGTTVAALKELLAAPPHNLPVPASNRVLERRGSLLMGLPDQKAVTPEVALLGFVPATPAPEKAATSPTAGAKLPAVKSVAVKVTTNLEKFQNWQRTLELPKDTTIADLKRILTAPPHNLRFGPGQRVLYRQKNQSILNGLQDADKVQSDLVLLNFNPDGVMEKPAVQAAPQKASDGFKNFRPQNAEAAKEARRLFEAHIQKKKDSHNALAPGIRRLVSYAMSIDWCKIVLGMIGRHVRQGTHARPCVVWVLNCMDEVEVLLARNGFFHDGNWQDRCPTEIVLLGEELDEFEMDGEPSSEGGTAPRIRSAHYSAIAREHQPPDLVVFFMPAMGPERASGTAPCAGPVRIPKEVLDAVKTAPIVLTTRRKIPGSSLNTLAGRGKGGLLSFTSLRNPFSALGGREAVEYDENGWVVGVQDAEALGHVLKLDMLPEFLETSHHASDESEHRTPALFWGIIDLKYNPSANLWDRVKMLETGDGRTSRFSGAGAVCQKRYKEKYRLEDGPGTGKSAVISANKKLTHDLMVARGFPFLVPKQVCFNRVYTEDLAQRIIEGLEVGEDDVVVLKLCNRTRAAGVLPVPVLDLDNMLKKILRVPKDIEGWLSRELHKGDEATLGIAYGCLEEQLRHWWSNECPFFVVEQIATSVPTMSSWSGEAREYDGTMRVAFALRRKDSKSPKGQKSMRNDMGGQFGGGGSSSTMPPAEDIEIDWLGGYWKLPKEPVESVKLRDSIISAAKTGTTYVEMNHLLEVFGALGDSVQQLFGGVEPVASTLAETYAAEPELAAYLVGRIGIAMRDLSSCRRTVDLGRKVLERAADGPSKMCAQSFISRGFGVVDAMTPPGRWAEAQVHFQKSIENQPANASSLYLLGMAHLEQGQTLLAVEFMRKAMVLDLDFRAPYVNLGAAYIRLQEFDAAIAVSEACLKRHPESPQCNYHVALACYFKTLKLESRPVSEVKEAYERLRQRGLHELSEARDSDEAQRAQHRSRVEAPWLEEDDLLGEALKPGNGFLGKRRDLKSKFQRPLEIRPDIGWRFMGWRT